MSHSVEKKIMFVLSSSFLRNYLSETQNPRLAAMLLDLLESSYDHTTKTFSGLKSLNTPHEKYHFNAILNQNNESRSSNLKWDLYIHFYYGVLNKTSL